MLKLDNIHLSDPFILPVWSEGIYYLYGSAGENTKSCNLKSFDIYRSRDLLHWEGPIPIYRPNEGVWADGQYEAPEVHEWRGNYYLFANFKSKFNVTATQILIAEHPVGPFKPNSNSLITPSNWECLDGTFYVDLVDQPWIVFCRDWFEVKDGQICAARLSEDLNSIVGEPITLFRASEVDWVHPILEKHYVTKGPFLYRPDKGTLLMLWSSIGEEGYAIGSARSLSGEINGPWIHSPAPIIKKDGGHSMLFKTFEGDLLIAYHAKLSERPMIYDVTKINC